MRPVNIADLEAGAMVLLAVPAACRANLARSLCDIATEADQYRRTMQVPHPVLGTGTVMSAASLYKKALRSSCPSHEYLSCVHILVTELLGRVGDQIK